eukprot:GHVT01006659.1.p1 GENE.GHVT01006659.1~~GHVT01006659.1.p1  ORF type:complete len:137 (-),score=10.99 GHVT01006659.1:306-716(-)
MTFSTLITKPLYASPLFPLPFLLHWRIGVAGSEAQRLEFVDADGRPEFIGGFVRLLNPSSVGTRGSWKLSIAPVGGSPSTAIGGLQAVAEPAPSTLVIPVPAGTAVFGQSEFILEGMNTEGVVTETLRAHIQDRSG